MTPTLRRDFILVSPIAFEPTGDPLLPDGEKENQNLKLYSAAVAEVAAARNLAFVDVFEATHILLSTQAGLAVHHQRMSPERCR
jgi:hypothetical protein